MELHRRLSLGKAAFWLLNHTRKIGVPSWIPTDNLTLRMRPLCVLSYGDESWYARRVTLPIQALI